MTRSTTSLLFALCLALAALWFLDTFHKVEQQRYVGFGGEALRNDYLAAQKLLAEYGIEAESRASITPSEWLPDVADTLLVPLSSSLVLGAEKSALLEWVAAGGRLILLRGESSDDTSDFVALLGYALHELDYVEVDDTEQAADVEEALHDLYELDIGYVWHRIEILDEAVDSTVVLYGDDVVAVQRSWENGAITLLANPDQFHNGSIQLGRHANLLLDLVSGAFDSGKVWFVYSAVFRPLWQVIWESAPFLVLSLALLFVMWLWSAMPIFGPRIETTSNPRRSIIEHIRAAGVFVWRHDGGGSLSASSKQALLHDAEARHPMVGRQSMEKQARSIAKMTGLSAQDIADALNGPAEARQREFANTMKKQQSIRNEL